MEKDIEDDILSKQKFENASGVNLDDFLLVSEPEEKSQESEETIDVDRDIAIGEVSEIFSRAKTSQSKIVKDKPISHKTNSVSDTKIEGEKRLHYGLMISMIVVWSAIGTLLGTSPIFSTLFSAIGLFLMAVFGLWLGEIWIPRKSMQLLGVTWVIISMKLLYGLAISMYSWDWISQNELGLLLLGLVGVNIGIAQHHDEDAIATQATLVLLVIGSAAGEPYGERGVALMIAIGTLLFHSLAYLRNSGNLASLGIAVSYLWIGIHSISNGWDIFGIRIQSFADELLLFLLMFGVTGINAVMATKFASAENWFSSAFKAIGLGKPGLWSVSVGLGMIGALLAIASNRLETGYALAQLTLLLSAFAPSYLIVRGESWSRLQRYTLWPAPILLAVLILMVRNVISVPISDPYSIFAAICATITTFAILNHQRAVSDQVLWIGSIVIVILITLLINAETSDYSRIMLLSQSVVWFGLAGLAVYRDSPSLAGTASIAPWVWLAMFASDIENRLVSVDVIPINISEIDISVYILSLILMQIPLNLKLGESGVNLAGRLVGMSELSARMRDSGMMRLWNINFIIALLAILFVTSPGIIPAYGVIIAMCSLILSHAIAIRLDRHQGTPRFILTTWALAAIIIQWRFGYGALWITAFAISSMIILNWSQENADRKSRGENLSHQAILPEKLITLTLGMISIMLMLIALDEPISSTLNDGQFWENDILNLRVGSLSAIVAMSIIYLPRASKLEKLLPSAIACIAILTVIGVAGFSFSDDFTIYVAGICFVSNGAWLAAQGEIRSRLKQVAIRDQRINKYAARKDSNPDYEIAEDKNTGIRMVDAELIELSELQKKRSRRRASSGDYDLIVGDIHHKPTVVISFIVVTLLVGIYIAWNLSESMLAISMASFISVLLIGIARWRAEQVNLQLPDILGIESPVAITMVGLTLIQIAGRLGDTNVEAESQWESLVLLGSLILLSCISLLGRKDLGLRIPSVLEGVVFLIITSRILTALMGVDKIQHIPNSYDGLSWIVPVWGIEIFLIAAVILFEWVENERLKRGLGDHRGSAGRIFWATLVIISSFGLAGLLVVIFSVKNSIKWTQPAVPLGVSIIIPIGWTALGDWISIFDNTTGLFMIAVGFVGMGIAIVCTYFERGLWISSCLWISHLLMPAGAFGHYQQTSVLLVVLLLAVSTTSWLIGVVTLRRSWRVIGALDLVLSWIIAGILVISGVNNLMILSMLIATAVLLGLVTWLGQKYEKEIAET